MTSGTGRGERAQRPSSAPGTEERADREPPPPGEEPEAGDQATADPDRPSDDVWEGNTLVEPVPGD